MSLPSLLHSALLLLHFHCRLKRVQRQRAQQVSPQPALNLRQTVGSRRKPLEIGSLSQLREFTLQIRISDQLRRLRFEEQQVLQQRIEAPQQEFDLCSSLSPCSV